MIPDSVLVKYIVKGAPFIETGTRDGETCLKAFHLGASPIHTVERDPVLYTWAKERLDPIKANVYLGDSRVVLAREILPNIHSPSVFWIDAHMPGNRSPILEELDAIHLHPVRGHTILIDDLRCYRISKYEISMNQVMKKISSMGPCEMCVEPGFEPEDILAVRFFDRPSSRRDLAGKGRE